ncbi:thyroglobulin [Nasonia vitripennis]|uniref:Thyroglobulin type-1 domain-containing protein n=1 Tax=Nasonia vitripennis TaxID=7425 RepID=A0A7M7HCI6_NASVI|nr:thyroglobulin [Nasonia vitripennis]
MIEDQYSTMFGRLNLKVFLIILIFFPKYLVSSSGDVTKACDPAGLNEPCNKNCDKCLPGLICNEAKICAIAYGTCESHQWLNNIWKPSCEKDGTYSAVQCKGEYSNGRCFCFSPDGHRIFGWSWWNSAKNMTCACSRRQYEIKKQTLKREDVSLHCTQNGNYEELQCDNGLCWCVEPLTGRPTQRAYPESLMTYLPCYNQKLSEFQYLRQCESKLIAIAKIVQKVKHHGHNYYHPDNVLCDDDGSYGPVQVDRAGIKCTWKDGKKIFTYLTENVGNIADINCNCARDSVIYSNENLEFRLQCNPDGNYKPQQSINGRSFCVDKDGFATSDKLGNIGENLKCT